MNIRQSARDYEAWLRTQLEGDVVESDIKEKHRRMSEGPFPFLRATYWRWAETILDVCPDLADAPEVLAVGDTHLENFGTWRDAEGRLVWGVNDFDEAAEMPYALDVVRLAVSALLGRASHRISIGEICACIQDGYEDGLGAPSPIVLDEKYKWLRKKVTVSEKARSKFWQKMEPKKPKKKKSKKKSKPDRAYVEALDSALPEKSIKLVLAPRTAGTGSLGRPRWLGYGIWRGAPLVREAKAIVPSAWTRPEGRSSERLRCKDIATGRHRSPDPWYDLVGNVLVRRLSPNNRKIEVEEELLTILDPKMLRAMGRDLACVHLGTEDRSAAIKEDLTRRKRRWLTKAVEAAADSVISDQARWRP